MFTKLALLAVPFLPAVLGQISNDFESGWDNATWPVYAPDCQQGGSVSLDSTKAHSGKYSMKVVGGSSGYCGHIFFGTTAVPKGSFYTRTWLWMTTPLTSDHVSFMVFPDSSLGAGKHLRFGGMDEIMMYNRENDDATLPDLSPQGIAASADLPAASWQCLEQYIGSDGTIQTWLNSADVSGLSVGGDSTNANSQGWARAGYKPTISGAYWGWEAYSGGQNTFWYDDVAVSSTRVGCGASGAGSGSASSSASAAKPTTTVAAVSTTVAPTTTASPKPTTTLVTSAVKPTTTSAAAPSATAPASSAAPAPSSGSCSQPKWAQCGGNGWTGCTVCASGSTCTASNPWYSQCL